ncbi:vWA domain-containing protein [Brachybacterium sp. AOP43-C2-M15]|uniref:vWA domain-containing protein n=1 Tax=Brachybacterium sp. AOP43-C2-M15 TaxID=3457661 RepID=UPI004033BDC1
MTSRPLSRPLALALATILLTSLVVLAPAAQPGARAEGYNTGRTAPSMLVFDASGSMRDADVDGRSRMDVAKEAVTTLVPMLPEDATVGLMTYGSSDAATAADQEAGCQDVKMLVEPTGLDRDGLISAIEGVEPSGYTPIGLSLQKAAAALPEAEMRSIVLVSDGIDECGGPPPCEVAGDLASQHPELRIHTIGFKAEQDARDELSCIAETTGGTFADASDAETLRDELLVKMTRAIQGYATQGQAITGGTTPEAAVDLPPGSSLDVLEHGSEAIDDGEGYSRFYRLQLAPGEIAHVSATMVLPGGDGVDNRLAQLQLRTRSVDGVDCRIGDAQARAEADLGEGPITSTIATPRMGETPNLSCFGEDADGTVILEVERTGDPALDEAVPVEVQFFAEESVDLDRMPPPATHMRPQEPLAVPTDGEQIQPAFSFASAVPAQDGPMRGTIIPGEVQFFRIPAAYAQQVRAALALGDFTAPDGMDLTLQARIFSPLRDSVYTAVPPSSDTSASGASAAAEPGATMQLNQAAPIQFRNREDGGAEARSSFLTGDYYLQLAVVPSEYSADRLFEVPYVIDLDVVGEAGVGPELTGQGAVEDRSAADPGAVADPSDGGGEGGASDGGGAPELEAPPTDEEAGRLSLPPVVWALLGGLGGGILVAALTIGAVALVRRGR